MVSSTMPRLQWRAGFLACFQIFRQPTSPWNVIAFLTGLDSIAVEKEKIEIQSRNGGAKARPPRYRPASPRAHNYGEASKEAQAQEKIRGFSSRRLRKFGRLRQQRFPRNLVARPSTGLMAGNHFAGPEKRRNGPLRRKRRFLRDIFQILFRESY